MVQKAFAGRARNSARTPHTHARVGVGIKELVVVGMELVTPVKAKEEQTAINKRAEVDSRVGGLM